MAWHYEERTPQQPSCCQYLSLLHQMLLVSRPFTASRMTVGREGKHRANFPLRGKSRIAGIGVHFHRPQGGWLVFHRAKPGCVVFAAYRRHIKLVPARAPTSPAQRYFIAALGECPQTVRKAKPVPDRNSGPARQRTGHQPSRPQGRVNLREYR